MANDGDVTALAGSMWPGWGLLGSRWAPARRPVTSTRDGPLTCWLNELAFAPIDYAPDAPTDEWSGDRGCGVAYLSQQAGAAAGAGRDRGRSDDPLPERLVHVQALMAPATAGPVYETIGAYLGYALPDYADFYDFEHSCARPRDHRRGGAVIQARARCSRPRPGAAPIASTWPDATERHGQAVAAATSPELR